MSPKRLRSFLLNNSKLILTVEERQKIDWRKVCVSNRILGKYKFVILQSSLCLFSAVKISLVFYLSPAQVFILIQMLSETHHHPWGCSRRFSVEYYKSRIQLNIGQILKRGAKYFTNACLYSVKKNNWMLFFLPF